MIPTVLIYIFSLDCTWCGCTSIDFSLHIYYTNKPYKKRGSACEQSCTSLFLFSHVVDLSSRLKMLVKGLLPSSVYVITEHDAQNRLRWTTTWGYFASHSKWPHPYACPLTTLCVFFGVILRNDLRDCQYSIIYGLVLHIILLLSTFL